MTYNIKNNDLKQKVWDKLVKLEGLPVACKEAADLELTTELAIETAILMTAQAIFEEILNKQKTNPVAQHSGLFEGEKYNIIMAQDVVKIEDKWLHDACNFCNSRLPSVIRRKDGKRICARCEAAQPYTKEKIHGKDVKL